MSILFYINNRGPKNVLIPIWRYMNVNRLDKRARRQNRDEILKNIRKKGKANIKNKIIERSKNSYKAGNSRRLFKAILEI